MDARPRGVLVRSRKVHGGMAHLRLHPDLLAAFRAGDKLARDQVYRHYARPLDHLLRRGYTIKRTGLRIPPIKDRSLRADILQEAFVRAFAPEMIAKYDGERDYLPFLAAIAFNAFVSQYRRRKRELPAGARESWADGQVAEIEPNDESEIASEDPRALAVMHEFVEALPEPLRSMHKASHTEGLGREKVAARFGITVWALRVQLDRMREELHALLVSKGIRGKSDE